MLNQYPMATRPLRLVYRHRPPPHSRSPSRHPQTTTSSLHPSRHSPQPPRYHHANHAITQNHHVITTKPPRHSPQPPRHHHKPPLIPTSITTFPKTITSSPHPSRHHHTSTSSPQNQHVIPAKAGIQPSSQHILTGIPPLRQTKGNRRNPYSRPLSVLQ